MSKNDLTEKQKLFCLEYLKDFNATRAAEAAGFSKRSAPQQASRLLSSDNIMAELAKTLTKVHDNTEQEIKDIINELKMIAFSDIGDVMDIDNEVDHHDESGQRRKKKVMAMRSRKEMGAKSRLIQEITEDESLFSTRRKIKLYDKMRAIELLGKYHKLFVETVDLKNSDGKLSPIVQIYLPDNGRNKKEGKE